MDDTKGGDVMSLIQETEAKSKVCPFIPAEPSVEGYFYTRHIGCLGSECMAWEKAMHQEAQGSGCCRLIYPRSGE